MTLPEPRLPAIHTNAGAGPCGPRERSGSWRSHIAPLDLFVTEAVLERLRRRDLADVMQPAQSSGSAAQHVRVDAWKDR